MKKIVNAITTVLGVLAILAGIFAPILIEKSIDWYYPVIMIILGVILIYVKNDRIIDVTTNIIEKLK